MGGMSFIENSLHSKRFRVILLVFRSEKTEEGGWGEERGNSLLSPPHLPFLLLLVQYPRVQKAKKAQNLNGYACYAGDVEEGACFQN